MSSVDLSFTIIVCAAIVAFTAIRITRILKNNWEKTQP
jgi:hypothetical protein